MDLRKVRRISNDATKVAAGQSDGLKGQDHRLELGQGVEVVGLPGDLELGAIIDHMFMKLIEGNGRCKGTIVVLQICSIRGATARKFGSLMYSLLRTFFIHR